jgi:xylan 1,4-beta-xylosidase
MNTSSYEQVNFDTLIDINPILTNFVYTDMHWHKELEIVFACKDALELNVQGEKLILEQGGVYIINSELLHSVNSLPDNHDGIVFLLQISENFMRGLHINMDLARYSQLPEHSQVLDEIRDHLLSIIDEIREGKPAFEMFVHSHCCSIIALLTRGYLLPEREIKDQTSINDANMARIKRILAYIQDHYQENPSLADIAAGEYVSPYYLSHVFTKSVGMNYTQYLNIIKVGMVRRDLTETNDSITDIMHRNGFDNIKTFNRIFKKIVGCSPTDYRRSAKRAADVRKFNYTKADSRFGNYVNLKRNIEIPDNLYRKSNVLTSQVAPGMREIVIDIDANAQIEYFDHYYQVLTAAARAFDLLRADVREHFRIAQREIGFKYVRFHGIFNDEMCVLDPEGDGKHYNFSYIDNIFDFLIDIGIRPFVEFSFMPTAIASGQRTVFFYKANISPPKDIRLWQDLIHAFINHIVDRYSIEEVRHWYFEVWNEPSLPSFWDGDFDDYMELYRATALEIKRIDPKLRVGGPAAHGLLDINAKQFLRRFLEACRQYDLPVDFVSAHPYPAYYYNDNGVWKEKLCGPEQTKEDMLWVKNVIRNSSYPKAELHFNEWSNSSLDRDLMHDTTFMAVFILHNIVNCIGLANSLTYWELTDLMEENSASSHEFHGGFGLLNKNGLKKPAYFAFQYLSRLSNGILSRGKNYIVTTNGEKIQILAWNYCHYTDKYASGDWSSISFYKRYEALDPGEQIRFSFHLPIKNGDYWVERVQFDREHGSVFDQWLRNGAKEYMTHHQLELIREQSIPIRGMNIYEVRNGILELSATVDPLGFIFLEISPVHS